MLSPAERAAALDVAVRAVREPLSTGHRWAPDPATLLGELGRPGASFVTLHSGQALLGCIGSLVARRALGLDIAGNAAAAAFDDPRMPAVCAADLPGLDVEVSVLGPLQRRSARGHADLRAVLRPGIDGLLVENPGHRATFLPSVWSQLADPAAFVAALWRKAGLPPDDWPQDLRVSTYEVEKFGVRLP